MNVVWKVLPQQQIHSFKADALCMIDCDPPKVSNKSISGSGQARIWLNHLKPSTATTKPVFKESVAMTLAGWSADKVAGLLLPTGSAADLRSGVACMTSWLRQEGVGHLALVLPPQGLGESQIQSLLIAVCDALDKYTTTLSNKKSPSIQKLTVVVSHASHIHRSAAQRALAVANGVSFAKEWANRPPNHSTPTHLAQAAKSLVGPRVKVQTLARKQIEALGMGAFLAVTQGSEEPPQFITMEYKGKGAKGDPIVLIGKGITFDTGGISLKPSAEMDEMKFDMGGAASVLGTFKTLSEIDLPIHVIGLIPSCENMPSGKAVKPGDVVRAMNGTTIEILNTDAEGRLILCDALCYSARFKPRVIIDVATLTGACVVALGSIRSGMYANNNALAQALENAGDETGDLCWRMPLDDAYADGLKSNFADIPNIAGFARSAGSVVAAKFLEKFVPANTDWGHLDIAGTAWKSGAQKGATGRPVPLLTQYLFSVSRVS